uniref:Uncharacterized protein n=1 Tax=Anopheles merus TaxID=30066 RepID=A0A182UZW1_ANOME
MCSPLTHLVPVASDITRAVLMSYPWVITNPASTLRRLYTSLPFITSLNFSITSLRGGTVERISKFLFCVKLLSPFSATPLGPPIEPLLVPADISPNLDCCSGLNEMLQIEASAALAAAFFAIFLDGPVPSNRWLSFTVTTTVNFECCSPSDETHSKWASVKSSCSSITGPFSGCGFGWWPAATFPLLRSHFLS